MSGKTNFRVGDVVCHRMLDRGGEKSGICTAMRSC